jgi:hypothetical protein
VTELEPSRMPAWQIGRYRFSRWSRAVTGGRARWGASADGKGVANYRTPLGAFIALRRFMRTS